MERRHRLRRAGGWIAGLLIVTSAARASAQTFCVAGTVPCRNVTTKIVSVTVPGATDQLNSGIVVEKGQSCTIAATGTIRVGVFLEGPTEPDGWDTQGPAPSNFPTSDAYKFALIYRIGSGPWRSAAGAPC